MEKQESADVEKKTMYVVQKMQKDHIFAKIVENAGGPNAYVAKLTAEKERWEKSGQETPWPDSHSSHSSWSQPWSWHDETWKGSSWDRPG